MSDCGATKTMISNSQMITIYVGDMARSVEFYTEKLGFVKAKSKSFLLT